MAEIELVPFTVPTYVVLVADTVPASTDFVPTVDIATLSAEERQALIDAFAIAVLAL